ncbi:MAG: hypothetical protein ACLQRM_07900, partial [Acidimicrobiales bacterium]
GFAGPCLNHSATPPGQAIRFVRRRPDQPTPARADQPYRAAREGRALSGQSLEVLTALFFITLIGDVALGAEMASGALPSLGATASPTARMSAPSLPMITLPKYPGVLGISKIYSLRLPQDEAGGKLHSWTWGGW